MAERVVLHIGTMKSGSSYLQHLLFAQRPALAAAGVLVPGRNRVEQIDALMQGRLHRKPRDLWEAMVAEVHAHPGTAVLSHELLGAATDKVFRNLLPDLGAAPVEAVVTVRDLNRTLVSMWQETVQNGRTWTWDHYYAAAEAAAPYARTDEPDPQSAGGTFWKQQDVARIVRRWVDRLGPERVTVVVVPPKGADRAELPRRFAAAAGIPLDPTVPSPRPNESLGLASVLVVRRLNELLEEQGHPWPDGMLVRKRLLAKKVLAARAADEPRLALDPPAWVREQTDATVAALQDAGARCVGDWADLEPVPVPGVRPEDVDPHLVTEAALAALAAMVARAAGAADRTG